MQCLLPSCVQLCTACGRFSAASSRTFPPEPAMCEAPTTAIVRLIQGLSIDWLCSEQHKQLAGEAGYHTAHRHGQCAEHHCTRAQHLHLEAPAGVPQQCTGAARPARQAPGFAARSLQQVQDRGGGEAAPARWDCLPALPHSALLFRGAATESRMDEGRVLVWAACCAQAALAWNFCAFVSICIALILGIMQLQACQWQEQRLQ